MLSRLRTHCRPYLVVGWFAFLACACCETSKNDWPPSSVIYIDNPEVVTRERLVARRLREQSWLTSKLEPGNMPIGGMHGMRDVREFKGFISSTEIAFDPLGGDLQEARTRQATGQAQGAQAVDEARTLRDQLRLEQEVAEIRRQITAGTAPPTQTPPPAAANPSGVTRSELDAEVKTLNDKVTALDTKLQARKSLFSDNTAGTTPNPAAMRSAAELHPIDALHDQRAYRNEVYAALREVELDDTHDLGGKTIYTLKFDITVATQAATNRFARVRVREIFSPNAVILDTEYQKWVEAFRGQLHDQALAMQTTWSPDRTTEEKRMHRRAEIRALLARYASSRDHAAERAAIGSLQTAEAAPPLSADFQSLPWQQRMSQLSSVSTSRPYSRWAINDLKGAAMIDAVAELLEAVERDTQLSDPLRQAICYYTLLKHEKVRDYVDIDPPTAFHAMDGSLLYLPTIAEHEQGLAAFIDFFTKHENPYVYNLGPLEQAQNISDVAAVETLHNFVLSLKALIPTSGLTAGTYNEWIERSQTRLHAVQRVPLVVSFANPTSDVEWQAEQRVKSVRGELQKTQAALLTAEADVAAKQTQTDLTRDAAKRAVVATESRIRKLNQALKAAVRESEKLEGRGNVDFGWMFGPRFSIGAKGHVEWQYGARPYTVEASLVIPAWWTNVTLIVEKEWVDPITGAAKGPPVKEYVKVRLPGDPGALTSALFESSQRPKPYLVDPRGSDLNSYTLAADGTPQSLLIRGGELWRNPEVFLGSRRADEVQPLPDMNGLIATFVQVPLPADARDGKAVADLTVVTSHGADTLPGAVTIIGGGGGKPAYLKLGSIGELKLGSQIAFDVLRSRVPAGFAGHRLVISWSAPSIGAHTLTSMQGTLDSGRIAWTIDAGAGAALPAAATLTLDPQVQLTTDSPWTSVLTGDARSAAYFKAGRPATALQAPAADVSATAPPSAVTLTLADHQAVFVALPALGRAADAQQVQLLLDSPGFQHRVALRHSNGTFSSSEVNWADLAGKTWKLSLSFGANESLSVDKTIKVNAP